MTLNFILVKVRKNDADISDSFYVIETLERVERFTPPCGIKRVNLAFSKLITIIRSFHPNCHRNKLPEILGWDLNLV